MFHFQRPLSLEIILAPIKSKNTSRFFFKTVSWWLFALEFELF